MKTFKKFAALFLVCAMLLSLSACHGKDEVALTIDGVDVTTAVYLSAFIDADAEAKQKVNEQISQNEEETTQDIDYYSQTIDGLSFEEYVKTSAIKRCKEYVFYQKLFEDKIISPTDEELSEAEYYANSAWSSEGYAYLYEPNGVSYDTFRKTLIYSAYSSSYFKHLYGEGGEKEVAKKDIKENMLENYAIAYVLDAAYSENATEAQKKDLKLKLEGYGKRLQKGEDYLKLFNELNNSSETAPEKQKDGPKNVYAAIVADKSSSLTDYATADFDDVYELKTNEFIVLENEDETGLTLYLKLDINSDKYYYNYLKDTIVLDMKQDEFIKDIEKKLEKLTVEEHSWAIGRIKAEDIDYSKLEELYASAQQQSNY